jgi:hypothetical protein
MNRFIQQINKYHPAPGDQIAFGTTGGLGLPF